MCSRARFQPATKASDSGTVTVFNFRSIDDNLLGRRSVKLQVCLTLDLTRAHRIEPADNLDSKDARRYHVRMDRQGRAIRHMG
jgi:hypothetical protein